ncbi:MAG TPA: hypothetical protein VGO85_22125 [Caldimonas sp.]|nr:hypothetical protein [Caldimonas sp.]
MSIETIFAHVSCADIETSIRSYEKLFGVLPLEPERQRLETAGLRPGAIEATAGYFVLRLRDPDGNLVVLASARKS